MILIIYNILKQLKIKKESAILYTLIIHYFMYTIVLGGANYNILAIMFVLIGIYISLKYNNTKKFVILNGIIIYLVTFTKQNIGAYYFIGTILMRFPYQKRCKNLYKKYNRAKYNIFSIIHFNTRNVCTKRKSNRFY